MDPITQGALGAVAAQALLPGRHGHAVWIGGLAGGMLPDADVLLQSISDPALPWELHRHFTHGYMLAPVFGLVAAGLLWLVAPPLRRAPGVLALAAILGALTHAPLDLFTSYGTKVYWPFSLENATLDLYPIVDPLFTLALLVGVVLAARRRRQRPAVLALLFVALYTGAALHQRGVAIDAQATLARQRGHQPVRGRVMPLPASLLAWRSLYEVDGRMVGDLIRSTPWDGVELIEGGSLPLLSEAQALEGVRDVARVGSVFRRYAAFADGWVARLPDDAHALGDMRFSLGAGFRPPWVLRLAAEPDDPPVRWESRLFAAADRTALLAVIFGTSSELVPLAAAASREGR